MDLHSLGTDTPKISVNNMKFAKSNLIVQPTGRIRTFKSNKFKNLIKKHRQSKKYKTFTGNWKARIILWLFLWIEVGVSPVDTVVTREDIKILDNSENNVVDWNSRQEINSGTGTGLSDKCLHLELKWICIRKVSFSISNKKRNRKKKMENGNGNLRQHVNIIQWNMGAKQWQRNFLEIEAVILQFTPDIFIVTKAKHENVPDR